MNIIEDCVANINFVWQLTVDTSLGIQSKNYGKEEFNKDRMQDKKR